MSTNLIPMAGEGKRFKDEGYPLPKPLIPVSGKPMILQAINGMPPSEKWIFLCRKEHLENHKIDKTIKKEIPNAQIMKVEKLTEGQACTCLLAKDVIDKKEPLFIGACDNGMVWDKKKWEKLISDKSIDAVVWTFTKQTNLLINPKAWGWVDVGDEIAGGSGKIIKKISVKVPISDNPYNDQAVIGSFWFRTGQMFIDLAEELVKRNMRVNNEFYVDSIPNLMIEKKMKVATFLVDKYIGWGTPNDLRTYEYWESYFKGK